MLTLITAGALAGALLGPRLLRWSHARGERTLARAAEGIERWALPPLVFGSNLLHLGASLSGAPTGLIAGWALFSLSRYVDEPRRRAIALARHGCVFAMVTMVWAPEAVLWSAARGGPFAGQPEACAWLAEKRATPVVLRSLESEDPAVRRRGVRAVRKLLKEDAAGELANRLGDSDPRVRWEATRALGRLNSSEASAGLIRALGDGSSLVADEATAILTKSEGPGVSALLWTVRDGRSRTPGDPTVQRPSAPAALLEARAAVGERWPRVRVAAIEILSERRYSWGRYAIEDAVGDPDPGVRSAAERALGKRAVDRVAVEQVLRRLGTLGPLDSPTLGPREKAEALSFGLRTVGGEVLPDLVHAFEELGTAGRDRLKQAVREEPARQDAAALVLMELGDKEALPLIRAANAQRVRHQGCALCRAIRRLERVEP